MATFELDNKTIRIGIIGIIVIVALAVGRWLFKSRLSKRIALNTPQQPEA